MLVMYGKKNGIKIVIVAGVGFVNGDCNTQPQKRGLE
jgi:hypothetical protein